MPTRFEDEQAKANARKWYTLGVWSMTEKVDLEKLAKDFDTHWRFCHCTTCGNRIHDQNDIGNVEVFFDDEMPPGDRHPQARHHDCTKAGSGD